MAEEDEEEVSTGPRPFWSGVVSFGLVNLPVSLFSAYRSKPYGLKMVDQDGTPLSRRFFCEAEDRPLDSDDIVRGYPLEDGTFVVVKDEELDALAPEKTREIDLQRFVRLEELDPVYFFQAYFLVPDKRTTKAYRLLAQSMEEEQRAGIATFVMRNKEYLIALIAEKGILRAEVLRFHDEIATPEQVGLPEKTKPAKSEVAAMLKAIRQHTAKTFQTGQLADDYYERLQQLVQQKLKKKQDVIKAEAVEDEPVQDNVIDLMQILKARLQGKSVDETTARPAKKAGRKASGKSASAAALKQLSREELYEKARECGIAGRSKMSKAQLVSALQRAAAH